MYLPTYTHTHTHIHTHTHTQMSRRRRHQICTTHTHRHIYTQRYIYILHVYTHVVCTHTVCVCCIHAYVYICIHTCIQIYVCMYMYLPTYMHTDIFFLRIYTYVKKNEKMYIFFFQKPRQEGFSSLKKKYIYIWRLEKKIPRTNCFCTVGRKRCRQQAFLLLH